MLAVKAGVVKEPVVPVPPPPDETQEVLLVDDHVTLAVAPFWMEVGVAVKVITGVEATTVTVVLWLADPPGPVHVTE